MKIRAKIIIINKKRKKFSLNEILFCSKMPADSKYLAKINSEQSD
jgi:hypothetical protein